MPAINKGRGQRSDLGDSRYFALRRRYAIRMISRAASCDSESVRMFGFKIRLRRMVADRWRATTVSAWKAVRSTPPLSVENDGENNIVHSCHKFRDIRRLCIYFRMLTARTRERFARMACILALLSSSTIESAAPGGCSSFHVSKQFKLLKIAKTSSHFTWHGS